MGNNKQKLYGYIVAFQRGKKEAFTGIYKIKKNSLFYFIYSFTNNSLDSQIVLRETFLEVYRNLATLQDIESFDSWIFSIARKKTMAFLCGKTSSHAMLKKQKKTNIKK